MSQSTQRYQSKSYGRNTYFDRFREMFCAWKFKQLDLLKKVYDIYWHSRLELITMSNMLFNEVPLSKSENSEPWANDMTTLGKILTVLLSRKLKFDISMPHLKTPLDLFLEIHQDILSLFPRVPKRNVVKFHPVDDNLYTKIKIESMAFKEVNSRFGNFKNRKNVL